MLTTQQIRDAWAPPCTSSKARVTLFGGAPVSVDPRIVTAVLALSRCLQAFNYPANPADTGAYNCRRITGGTGYSLHAYGIAIDINWQQNPYGPVLRTNMPPAMIAAIQAIRTVDGLQVWRWGGTYTGNKDAMHFEIVITPAQLARGLALGPIGTTGLPIPIAQGSILPGSPATEIELVEKLVNEFRRAQHMGPIAVDGIYGNALKWSVAKFQQVWNETFHPSPPLPHTGGVDPATLRALVFTHSHLAA